MNKLSTVLFDFDGTLVDSERFYYHAWAPILAEDFQVHISFQDWIDSFAGHTLAHNLEFLAEHHQVQTSTEYMWKRTREAYAKQDMLSISLMPYALEIIQFFSEQHIQIGLVTSNFLPAVERILKHHELYSYFNFFVTREDVVEPKPQPECYLLAIEKSKTSPAEILVIEDTITGATAAVKAGLTCFGVSKQLSEQKKLKTSVPVFEDLHQVFQELADSGY